jgi:hypothetical protein
MIAEASVFNLLQIGELSKQQLSDEIKLENPSMNLSGSTLLILDGIVF